MNKTTIIAAFYLGLIASLSGCTEMKPFQRCGRVNCHATLPPLPKVIPPAKPIIIPAPKVVFLKSPKPVTIRTHFKLNSYALLERYIPQLNKIIKFGTKHQYLAQIKVDGYCSKVGSYSYNLKLSYQRANSVAHYLESHGVPADDILIRGYSYEDNIATNATKEGRFMNQRVVVSAGIQ